MSRIVISIGEIDHLVKQVEYILKEEGVAE